MLLKFQLDENTQAQKATMRKAVGDKTANNFLIRIFKTFLAKTKYTYRAVVVISIITLNIYLVGPMMKEEG